MQFEWDEAKAAANLIKHHISFEEAITVFDDPLYVDSEHRYIIIGRSRSGGNADRVLR